MAVSNKTLNIDSYIAAYPNEVQVLLKKMRSMFISAAPGAVEGISYGIPTFYLDGKHLVFFAAFKNHLSVYPATTQAVDQVKGLSKYKHSKGTLRFPLSKPIPFNLIEEFVKRRVAEQRAEAR